mgnify:CR=1 FL=1
MYKLMYRCLLVQLAAFIMVFVNIPSTANQGETYESPEVLEMPSKEKGNSGRLQLG